MSHFTVIVFGEGAEQRLDPYWELDLSQEDAKNDYRSVFEDYTQKIEKEFNNDGSRVVVLPDGTFGLPWDDEFKRLEKSTKGGKEFFGEYEVREVPYKHVKRFNSVDEFAKGWHGLERNEDGKFGYWVNPKAKWDWFSVGGRWNGYFRHIPKPKYKGDIKLGNPSLLSKGEKAPKYACDVVRKCDLDLELMKDAAGESARKAWTEAMKKEECLREIVYGIKKNTKKSTYVSERKKNFLAPHAIVHVDGSWVQKGEMGYFGFSKDENDNWGKDFEEIFKTLPDDTLLTMVDCHI